MQTIVTIGTGYSGSSALYEFLNLTDQFYNPFPNKEFSLTYDPGGILDIELLINNNFTPNKNFYIYQTFINNINFYTNSENAIKPGKNIKIKNKNIKEILIEYLNSITSLTYEGESNLIKYNNSIQSNLLKKILFKFGKKIKGQMVIFTNSETFKKKTEQLFDKLFNFNNLLKKDVLLDQGGSFWNPISTTKYYKNPKVFIVQRDPRDIFSEFKGKTANAYPGNNVESFCSWYQDIIDKVNFEEYKSPNILKINFEDFILNKDNIIKKFEDFLKIRINKKTDFNFEKSKKNIQRYKNNLNNFEINQIENKLSKYLY